MSKVYKYIDKYKSKSGKWIYKYSKSAKEKVSIISNEQKMRKKREKTLSQQSRNECCVGDA